MSAGNAILACEHLKKRYAANGQDVLAANDISFAIEPGESIGLVGESGSGKSTIAKMITLFEHPDEGSIVLAGAGDITKTHRWKRREVYKRVQMVFQNPMDSFDPRCTIRETLLETARNYGSTRSAAADAADRALELVGLKPDLAQRYRHQLSGGECQRAAIARALIPQPELLICDEVTSALDVSVQAQIVNLIHTLHASSNLSLLVISHDLAIVGMLCTRVLVLKSGALVEAGPTQHVLAHPQHPYTQALVAAAELSAKAGGAR